MTAEAPLVCLMGPTASGKSELAVTLAEQGPFGIVSVDSALVYRGMDIGTAKPAPAVLARVPHRLVDVADPAEPYSAARFCQEAHAAIAEVREAGRIPLLVGGTMLYFRALLGGLSPLPAADARLRARLSAEAEQVGWAALHRRLQAVDPQTAARLHPNDAQRIQRALEVYELSGRPLGELQQAPAPEQSLGQPVRIAIAPVQRRWLHERIERRFRAMLEQGLVEEVAALRARSDLGPELPSMRAVGYRQVWAYLEGRLERAELAGRGVAATRQLAKRQLTWLRREPELHWLDAADAALQNRLRDHLRHVLE